jgi:hypothetical protein
MKNMFIQSTMRPKEEFFCSILGFAKNSLTQETHNVIGIIKYLWCFPVPLNRETPFTTCYPKLPLPKWIPHDLMSTLLAADLGMPPWKFQSFDHIFIQGGLSFRVFVFTDSLL